MEELYAKMDAAVVEGHSREEVLKMFDKQINAYARAEYMRQCYLDSLSDKEYRDLYTTSVSRWLETE